MSPPCPDTFPCPVFEGSEKRISVTFSPTTTTTTPMNLLHGLRALSREQLDAMLDLAACQIISHRSNDQFDAYVLSESSLFVYPDRMVLKTCGTTKLLACVPFMVELAAGVGMGPTRVKYTRASFLFPEKQPEPHHGFEHECNALHDLFSTLGSCSAYVLGDALNDMQWHVFVAGDHNAVPTSRLVAPSPAPVYTMEVCMTGLSPAKSRQFFKDEGSFVTSEQITVSSGIADLFADHTIDDFLFEPCGYSMNGQCNGAFSTIHVTPEEGFSYASVELCGHATDGTTAANLVARAVEVFHPRSIAVTLSADTIVPGQDAPGWGNTFVAPVGYECHSASYQEIKCGGYVAYFTLQQDKPVMLVHAVSAPAMLTVPDAATDNKEPSKSALSKDAPGCDSPRGVLKHFPSCKTLAMNYHLSHSQADIELMATSSDNSSDCGVQMDRPASPDMRRCCHQRSSSFRFAFDEVVAVHNAIPLVTGDSATIDAHLRSLINRHALEDTFYVVDLGAVRRLYHAWNLAMPRVHPHYAVKCNNDPALLASLASLGAGFDCASEAEVEQVTSMGVSSDRIIFANPCKRPADIRTAAAKGIVHSTFDTEAELLKLRKWYPDARVLLRIRADDPTARCQLGNKFGAEEFEWESLFIAAQRHGIPVDGISFHVGSGATNPAAFSYAIELARKAFDLGALYGFSMRVLDIGGGFCGGRFDKDGRVDLGGVPAAVNAALAMHFPEGTGVRVIAEPGRYFAESIATLATLVYGRRARASPAHSQRDVAGGDGAGLSAPSLVAAASNGTTTKMDYDYWITDGLYGSMNCLLYDHATVAPRPLIVDACRTAATTPTSMLPHYPSTVFGPTCDGLDTVVREYPLPELEVGDWLVFPRMGAYTICGASKFNGVNAVDVPTFYVASLDA